ncbi:MAG TPA: GDSL-type esterase/lipase family protein [Candidatus Limnocylindria bacterium]|nr:GDSL-type esterase/lipase family protein [Candidatus Limnocylindria bacterium]
MRKHSRDALVICVAFLVACSPASTAQRPSSPGVASAPSAPTAAPSPTASSPAVRYVAIGASDTVGVGATDPAQGSWPARIAARLPAGSGYVNLGVSGSIALQAGREQLPGAIAQRPTVVTIWLAVNDLNATIDRASYAEALGGIVDALVQRTDAAIFVGNVPDLRAVPVYAGVDKRALLARITAYNDVIAEIAAKSPARVSVVDLFNGSADLVSTATVAQDGFHPSDAGYQLIADRFATAMRARGVPLRT